MKNILIIGSGISGMTCAISCARLGLHVTMLSPFVSERSQSVMAAGGINAALDNKGEGDSVEKHREETLKAGRYIAGEPEVAGLCRTAPEIIEWLEKLGTVFSRDHKGTIDQRPFGGQAFRRTCYSGSSTGKHIVSSLVMEVRRYEAAGAIERRLWSDFHSGLIKDGKCYGGLIFNESTGSLEPFFADATVIATGGQNALFGKTTGSTQCDGYAAGRLFMQGAALKNLEFIQYHPTTMETAQKKMLISEAARGEGGRLYYIEDGKRVYFMEDLFGEKGNLMPRDVVSRCMQETGRLSASPADPNGGIFLDVSFLGDEVIDQKLSEVRDLCSKYRGLDIKRESIPVTPSVHFFMGGLAVDDRHMTNIDRLYAVGECASKYHGANRLGGNSLLAAVYSGKVAAEAIADETSAGQIPDFTEYIEAAQGDIARDFSSESHFPITYIRDMAAESLNRSLGIVRDEESIDIGIRDLDYFIDMVDKLHYDRSVLEYFNYSAKAILILGRAALMCAKERRESRGAHYRRDYPETLDEFRASTIITYDGGEYNVAFERVSGER